MARTAKADQFVLFERPVATLPLIEPAPAGGPMESTPENFRGWMEETLAMLRACRESPWPPHDARYYRVLFQLRSEWLPYDEAVALRQAFRGEWERLAIEESEMKG